MSSTAVVFDLDGTLIDSIPTVAAILNQMRLETGRIALPSNSFHPWISKGGLELVGQAMMTSGTSAIAALATFRARYQADDSSASVLYPTVVEALNLLTSRKMPMAICTNKPRALVDKLLTKFGISHYFQCVLAGDDLPTQKPDSKNLEYCLKKLGAAKANSVFVGDSLVDQLCASNANVRYAFFAGGYDDGVDRRAAWLVFRNHRELALELLSQSSVTSNFGEP